jgi:SpoVK/Ycf46/Vps4 family AAA+-type ATPase
MVLSSVDKSLEETIGRIDWQLLQRQKKTLEKLLVSASSGVKSNIPAEDINNLWGLVELIENLQDVRENEMNNMVHFERMEISNKKINHLRDLEEGNG